MGERGLFPWSVGFFRRALSDESGLSAVTVAITFAVMAPMSLGLYDIFTMNQQRGKLQEAIDAAAASAARSTATSEVAIGEMGETALLAKLRTVQGAALLESSFRLSRGKVIADASIQLQAYAPTDFTHNPLRVHAEVSRGAPVEATASAASDRGLASLIAGHTASAPMS